jgi:formate hydrogenlyase subunit 3/multisubunit Na+/H+ antiporter MnhD subunit
MGAEIKIYQSLWKNLLLVICCVIFAIGAIFIIADDSCKTMTAYSGGYPFSISGDIRSVPS